SARRTVGSPTASNSVTSRQRSALKPSDSPDAQPWPSLACAKANCATPPTSAPRSAPVAGDALTVLDVPDVPHVPDVPDVPPSPRPPARYRRRIECAIENVTRGDGPEGPLQHAVNPRRVSRCRCRQQRHGHEQLVRPALAMADVYPHRSVVERD